VTLAQRQHRILVRLEGAETRAVRALLLDRRTSQGDSFPAAVDVSFFAKPFCKQTYLAGKKAKGSENQRAFRSKKGDSFPRGRRCVFFAKPFYKQAYFLRARL
jgi:hypothetical protein